MFLVLKWFALESQGNLCVFVKFCFYLINMTLYTYFCCFLNAKKDVTKSIFSNISEIGSHFSKFELSGDVSLPIPTQDCISRFPDRHFSARHRGRHE